MITCADLCPGLVSHQIATQNQWTIEVQVKIEHLAYFTSSGPPRLQFHQLPEMPTVVLVRWPTRWYGLTTGRAQLHEDLSGPLSWPQRLAIRCAVAWFWDNIASKRTP